MRICWRRGRTTAREVLEESVKNQVRDYRTILTLLTRIAQKGYLSVEKVGKTNNYTPAIEGEEALSEEIRRFLDEVVGPGAESRELLLKILKE